jgi:hypothetical protein
MEYKYIITGITWNAPAQDLEDLPESLLIVLNEQWNDESEEQIIEAIAEEYLWEPLSFTHEDYKQTDEDDLYDLEVMYI